MPTGFIPLDIMVLVAGIIFYFVVRNHLDNVLKVVFKLAIMFVFGVMLYGLASTAGQYIIDNTEETVHAISEVDIFQSFMGDGSSQGASDDQ